MTGFFVIFAVGVILGAWVRGGFARTHSAALKSQLRQEQINTRIERERLKQHKMLTERINS